MRVMRKRRAGKLQTHLDDLPAPQLEPPPATSPEDLAQENCSPSGSLQERCRPEIEPTREAVKRIAVVVEKTRRRAVDAEERLQTVVDFMRGQVQHAQALEKAADNALTAIESAAAVEAEAAAGELKTAERRAAEAHELIEELERRVESASAALMQTQQCIIDAQNRVITADKIASESKRDIEYLESFIQEELGHFGDSRMSLKAAA